MKRSIGVMMLHPGCNMRCRFCITDNRLSSMRGDQALWVLDHMQAMGMDNLVLGGGEPFLWEPGVIRLAEEAKRRAMFVQVGTNGVALPAGYERLECFDRYVLPLESAAPAAHDRMRCWVGSHHALILRRLEELAAAGKSITVSTVVTAENRSEIPVLAAFLADYALSGARLHAWHLYQFIPEGRGGARHADALRVREEDYDALCAEIKAMPLGFTVFKRKDMRHSRSVDFYWFEEGKPRIGSEVWGSRQTRTTPVPAEIPSL